MLYQLMYWLLFIICLGADRISKYWAVHGLAQDTLVITNNLSFSLAWNPGISWGMLQFSSPLYFWLLTSIISLVIVVFGIYTTMRYRQGFSIFFEIMVLAGAVSNIVDRCWYRAVIDFIELHIEEWYFPAFNIADACIVVGVVGIMIKTVYESYDDKH